MSTIPPDLVRRFWTLMAELTPSLARISRDTDAAFLQALMGACRQHYLLSTLEVNGLEGYIRSRLPLIREMSGQGRVTG